MNVYDIDAYIGRTLTSEGTLTSKRRKVPGVLPLFDKMQVPGVGWLAYMKDPEGNIFGMLQPTQ